MAVSKFNGFRAPYKSSFFRGTLDRQLGRNGIFSTSGPVTQVGPTITVPAFSIVQQGLIIEKDTTTTLSEPSIPVPYYLVISAPTPVQIDDLVFSFAKSPADISPNEVLFASYDGLDWQFPTFLTIDAVFDYINEQNIATGRVGPHSGLRTTVNGPNYDNSPGSLIDKSGESQNFVSIASFPIIADDPDYNRVDRILYRRPDDDPNRIGTREFLLGNTYDVAPSLLYDTEAFSNAAVRQTVKALADKATNEGHLITASGYGTSIVLSYTKFSSDRQTVVVLPITIASAVVDAGFDAAIDLSGNLHVVYAKVTGVFYRKFDSVGSPLTSEIGIAAGINRNPRIKIDPSESGG